MKIKGYLRADGRKGIRNVIVVAPSGGVRAHVASEIVHPYRGNGVHVDRLPGLLPQRLRRQGHAAAVHPSQRRGVRC